MNPSIVNLTRRWIVASAAIALTFSVICLSSNCAQGQTTPAKNSKAQDEKSADKSIADVASKLNKKAKYDLKYKLKKGEEIRWRVEHIETTLTRVGGQSDKQSGRTVSTKLWEVTSVDSRGSMTFTNSVEGVECSQQSNDEDPITYNSRIDKTAPSAYQGLSEMLGSPIAEITVNPKGQVIDRKNNFKQIDFGVGEITIPLPEQAISVGHKWHVSKPLRGENEAGNVVELKARVKFELSKVVGSKAYISFRTEVLTPVTSNKVRSQIMQHQTKGYVALDMELGRIVQKQVDWDETVQGFNGDDSYTEYLAKMTEKLLTGPVAKTSKATAPTVSSSEIKTRDGKPIMRK